MVARFFFKNSFSLSDGQPCHRLPALVAAVLASVAVVAIAPEPRPHSPATAATSTGEEMDVRMQGAPEGQEKDKNTYHIVYFPTQMGTRSSQLWYS